MPRRQQQPYRKSRSRVAGPVLDAMRRGADFYGRNPADGKRRSQVAARKRKRKRRSRR